MSAKLQVITNWETLAQQANYRPGELAILCQTSLRTLERFFQKQYRMTVGSWLREFRLNQAYQGLLTGKAVKEVSYDQGYKQVSHFSREFKARFGVAPSLILPSVSNSRRAISSSAWQVTPAVPQMVYTF